MAKTQEELNALKVELTDEQIELITGGIEDFGEEYNNLVKEFTHSIVPYFTMRGGSERDALGKRIEEILARILEIRLGNGAEPIEPLNIDGINIE